MEEEEEEEEEEEDYSFIYTHISLIYNIVLF